MAELLTKLFDITKLPSKFFAWIALLTGAFVFLPAAALESLHLHSFPVEYKAYAGVAFAASTTFLLLNVAIWLYQLLRGHYYARVSRKMVDEALSELDLDEIAVLREFYLQGRHVIELPIDHPTVAGLRNKGLIKVAGGTGYRDLAGSVFPVQLTTHARKSMTHEVLRLPQSRTQEDIDRILSERPNYIRQIEKQDRLRGGHFW